MRNDSATAATQFAVSPFEHFMAYEAAGQYPMSFFLRLSFTGNFDRDRFIRAFETALERHPFLQSRLSSPPNSNIFKLVWRLSASVEPPVSWYDTSWDDLIAAVGPLEIQNQLPLSCKVLTQGAETSILLQFHHAATDGLGAVSFVEDLLVAYSGNAPLRRISYEVLKSRDTAGLSLLRRLARTPRDVFYALRIFLFPARPIATPGIGEAAAGILPDWNITAQTCSSHELDQLKQSAKRHNATPNDLLISAYFRVLDRWNRRFGTGPRRISICMPASLRTSARKFPASNHVGLCFLSRPASSFKDPYSLLNWIKAETQYIRQKRMGLMLIGLLNIKRYLLLGYAHGFGDRKRCYATAVLTNIWTGLAKTSLPADEKGCLILDQDLVLSDIVGYPPLWRNTHLSLAVMIYAGRLHLTLSYNSRIISASHADEFLASVRSIFAGSFEDTQTN